MPTHDQSDRLTLECRDAVALVWLDRPAVINAIDARFCAELNAVLDRIETDERLGAMVIAGRGERGFCSGADLSTVRSLTGAAKRRFIETAWLTLDRVARLPVPSIAALHGHVLGGGLELALACDLRYADPGAKLGLPELGLGSVPSFGAVQRLPTLIGRGRAIELMLFGRRIGADEACRIGLVTQVAGQGEVVQAALSSAETLSRLPREAIRYLRTSLDMPAVGTAASLHGMISDLCHSSPDYQARIARFTAKKPKQR